MNPQKAEPCSNRSLSVLRRLRRNEEGATALEFAMVVAPFLMFIIQTIEVAFVYGGTVALEHALEQSARKIRVGTPMASITEFKNDVCSHVVLLSDCNGKLIVDVRTLGSLGGAGGVDVMSDYTDSGGALLDPGTSPDQYDVGQGGSDIMVNVFYKWDIFAQLPFFINWQGTGAAVSPLANQADGSRVVSATVIFKNEPF